MTATEGVVKFQLEFSPAPALPAATLAELNAWRQFLCLTKLIGQDPALYGGYGYGNISQRLEPFDQPVNARRFVITGTQTGGLATLGPDDYTTVLECYPERNLIVGEGPVNPSSESLTHGMIYDLDAEVRWVMHAHSNQIWRHAAALNLPMTDAAVPYGSPEMAAEVDRLFRETDVRAQRVFGMYGHEDGVVSFGRTAQEAGHVLVDALVNAFALD